MRSLSLLSVSLVLTVAFAGCVLPLADEGGTGTSVITRKVVVTVDSRSEGGDEFEDYVDTTLEYRHPGPAMSTSGLTASYLDESGDELSRPLSVFTSATTLSEGDVVRVTGANVTSGLVIRDGDRVLASRDALETAWFTAEGAPIPLHSTQAGAVRYTLQSSGGFEAQATDFDLNESAHVESFTGRLSAGITGTSEVTTSLPPEGPRVSFETSLTPQLEFEANARVREDGSAYDLGARTANPDGDFDARLVLQFNPAHRLTKVGTSSKVFFDVNFYMWDRDHSRASNYEPEDVDHPIVDETTGYSEESVSTSAGDIEAWVVEFLDRIWSMKVGVGDDYRLHVDVGDDESGRFLLDFIVQIAAEEPRQASGRVFQSYRVNQIANFVVDPPHGGTTTFDIVKGTYWVDRISYLPLYVSTSYTKTFTKADIEKFFDVMGEEAPVELPATANLVVREETTLRLESYEGNIQTAPILGIMSANQGLFTGMGAGASMFLFMSDIGSQSEYDYEEPPPMVFFSQSEAADRLNVVSTSRSDWSGLGVRTTSDTLSSIRMGAIDPYVNDAAEATGGQVSDTWLAVSSSVVPVRAGDFLEFCATPAASNIQIEIHDLDAEQLVASFHFSSLALC